MKFNLKKFVAGISAIVMLSTMGTSYLFADEIATTTGVISKFYSTNADTLEEFVNIHGKPLLEDATHGDTNLEDMVYVHYDYEQDIKPLIDELNSYTEMEYTEDNLSAFFELDNEINLLFEKVYTSYSLIYLYYCQNPTDENTVEYAHSSDLLTKFQNEYLLAMKNSLSGSFGTAFFEDLQYSIEQSTNEDEIYFLTSIYEMYHSYLTDDISEEATEIYNQLNQKSTEYFNKVQTDLSNIEVNFNGDTMTYADLMDMYLSKYYELSYGYESIEDIPTEDLELYYSIENTIIDVKTQNGVDNNTLGQLYIDIVKLYNQLAQLNDYSNYVDYAYQYDIDEVNQISEDVKNYIVPLSAEYIDKLINTNKYVEVSQNKYSLDETKEIADIVIANVGDEYHNIYTYMNDHNLLTLDDDYSYSMGYTTILPEYSEAYIYLTFSENSFYENVTNGIAHEFGHFIDWYNNSDMFASTGMGTAENVSISFSYLCNDNLDAYFDEVTSDTLAIGNNLNNINVYLIQQIYLNAFEIYAYQNADTITPEDLDQKFIELNYEYGLSSDIACDLGMAKEVSWYTLCSQLYTLPFYEIDYAMAGLTATDILCEYSKDRETGLQLFDSLYTNEYYGDDYITMMQNGVGIDLYADDFVSNLSNNLKEYFDTKLSTLTEIEYLKGDINCDDSVDVMDLIILKKHILGVNSIETNFQAADLNEDGSINIFDVLNLKEILFN